MELLISHQYSVISPSLSQILVISPILLQDTEVPPSRSLHPAQFQCFGA